LGQQGDRSAKSGMPRWTGQPPSTPSPTRQRETGRQKAMKSDSAKWTNRPHPVGAKTRCPRKRGGALHLPNGRERRNSNRNSRLAALLAGSWRKTPLPQLHELAGRGRQDSEEHHGAFEFAIPIASPLGLTVPPYATAAPKQTLDCRTDEFPPALSRHCEPIKAREATATVAQLSPPMRA